MALSINIKILFVILPFLAVVKAQIPTSPLQYWNVGSFDHNAEEQFFRYMLYWFIVAIGCSSLIFAGWKNWFLRLTTLKSVFAYSPFYLWALAYVLLIPSYVLGAFFSYWMVYTLLGDATSTSITGNVYYTIWLTSQIFFLFSGPLLCVFVKIFFDPSNQNRFVGALFGLAAFASIIIADVMWWTQNYVAGGLGIGLAAWATVMFCILVIAMFNDWHLTGPRFLGVPDADLNNSMGYVRQEYKEAYPMEAVVINTAGGKQTGPVYRQLSPDPRLVPQ